LDGYQGWEDAVETARRLGAVLLVATQSNPAPLVGLGARLRVVPLAHEADRRRAHAAADVALVTRRAPGGLPIKLLDALSRGLPVVAPRRALAGLLARGVRVTADDDAGALARSAAELLRSPDARARLAEAGPAYVSEAHAPARFVRAFRTFLRGG
ncbi:MAG: glycosyltransferase, partial [Myxococcota bacterium]